MSTAEAIEDPAPRKASKLPLVIGAVAALALGGGGYYAASSGLLFGGGGAAESEPAAEAMPDVSFVALDPLVVSLGGEQANRHLRFKAQLEVEKGHEAEVEAMLPRVVDVLNSYLRAVDIAELEDPGALIRLRAQMLRRVQIVTGEGRIRDLLVMEFVLN